VFCSIVDGKERSWTIFENQNVKTILDIHPASKGHALVLPKRHYENIFDIPEETLAEVMSVAKHVVLQLQKSLGVEAVNLLSANGKDAQQSVFHFHIHVVPRKPDDGLNLWWNPGTVTDADFDRLLKEIVH